MSVETLMMTMIDWIIVALIPLGILYCVAGVFTRKSDPKMLSFGLILLVLSFLLAFMWTLIKGFWSISDNLETHFQDAIREQKTVSYEGIIPQTVFSISQYWWVILAAFLALIFVPFFRGRVRKG